MRERAFSAMGTSWWLGAYGVEDAALVEGESLVREIEARLSRFRPDSAVTELNERREATDPMLALVVLAALAARRDTDGAFDPAVGEAVVRAGYDRSFELLPERGSPPSRWFMVNPPAEKPTITVHDATVRLRGPGRIDLGGIAKGWAVDRVAALLERCGATGWMVDGGGDIRVGGTPPEGEWCIGIGEEHAVGIRAGAVATSSTRKRRWTTGSGEAHHIIDPRSGHPAGGPIDTVAVIAPDAATADMLATALIADPDAAWPALASLGAEAFVRWDNEWRMTPKMEALLR